MELVTDAPAYQHLGVSSVATSPSSISVFQRNLVVILGGPLQGSGVVTGDPAMCGFIAEI